MRSWDCEIVRSRDREIVRLWDCGIVRLWDCEHAWSSKWKGVEMLKFGVPGAARAARGARWSKCIQINAFWSMHGAQNGGVSKCWNLGCQEQSEQPGAPDDQNVSKSMLFGACMELEMEGCRNVEISWDFSQIKIEPREHSKNVLRSFWIQGADLGWRSVGRVYGQIRQKLMKR